MEEPVKSIKDIIREKVETLHYDQQKVVLEFVEFLQAKNKQRGPLKSSEGALAHLNIKITREDIDEARREMWGGYIGEDSARD